MKHLVLLLFSAAVGLSGCGVGVQANTPANNAANTSGHQASASPAPSPTVRDTSAVNSRRPAPADEAAAGTADFDGTAGVTEKKNAGIREAAILRDVRSARHENYDRIVFEFAGPDLPGYHIEYVDKPVRACGSGDVVPLAGDGWLEMRFDRAQAHTEAGEPTVKDRERSPNLPIVNDLKSTCDFEAEVTWVAGVSSPNRYRVLELKGPTRLVIDIKH